MKKGKMKVLTVVMCAVLLVAISVCGTLAYLTSQDEVVNTFTVGNVKITLDEAQVDTNGSAASGASRVESNSYKLIPGSSYTKDPTVHVDANSEDSWLFVKVENGIAAIEAAGDTSIAAQMAANGWTLVAGTTNVYAYKNIVKANDNIPVFASFKVDGNVKNEVLATYANAQIKVTAYAVQAAGFDSAAAAWTAAPLS